VVTDLNEIARERRAGAARMSRDLAGERDLATLLGVAQHGLGALFDGECTIQVGVGDQPEWIPSHGLSEEAVIGLAGPRTHEVVNVCAGILLEPESSTGVCRAWVQFGVPRRVSSEELIVGDLFAQAFAIAVDRVVELNAAIRREEQLREAVEGHRIIGQATGIMMERHRLTAAMAFELLRVASQNRNIRLRQLSQRVIDTGLEPDVA
jgi:hypothetical protein